MMTGTGGSETTRMPRMFYNQEVLALLVINEWGQETGSLFQLS
jgi:hypothetical protein